MPDASVARSRRVALVLQLIDSVARPLSESNTRHYGAGTSLFRDYVTGCAIACKRYLIEQVRFDTNEPSHVQRLRTVAAVWKELHKFVKPLSDASSLEVPQALLDGLRSLVRSVQGFEDLEIAVFHTEEFNYLELNASSLPTLASNIRNVVPDAPEFPKQLAVVGLPYSQGRGLDRNVLLLHEIGHHVFQKLSDSGHWKSLKEAIVAPWLDELNQLDPSEQGPITVVKPLWAYLEHWIEEIFADLFAVRLIGPSFTYAYLELVGSSPGRGPDRSFSTSHPADAFRLRLHVKLLKELGWWALFLDQDGGVFRELDSELSSEVEPFKWVSSWREYNALAESALQAFVRLEDVIFDFALKDLVLPTSGRLEFCDLKDVVLAYLAKGIVPSSLIVDGALMHPSVVVLCNASRAFNLKGIESLLGNLQPRPTLDAETYLFWSAKVEAWALKAIEDVLLLNNQRV